MKVVTGRENDEPKTGFKDAGRDGCRGSFVPSVAERGGGPFLGRPSAPKGRQKDGPLPESSGGRKDVHELPAFHTSGKNVLHDGRNGAEHGGHERFDGDGTHDGGGLHNRGGSDQSHGVLPVLRKEKLAL